MTASAQRHADRAAEPTPMPGTRNDAEAFCNELERSMDELIGLIEQETALVRSGKLFAAGELERRKSEVARHYVRDMQRMRSVGPSLERFAPVAVERLRRQHAGFRALLQINLAVLATAREVSEGLVRSVAEGVGVAGAPRSYGRAGTADRPAPLRGGIAIDQVL